MKFSMSHRAHNTLRFYSNAWMDKACMYMCRVIQPPHKQTSSHRREIRRSNNCILLCFIWTFALTYTRIPIENSRIRHLIKNTGDHRSPLDEALNPSRHILKCLYFIFVSFNDMIAWKSSWDRQQLSALVLPIRLENPFIAPRAG